MKLVKIERFYEPMNTIEECLPEDFNWVFMFNFGRQAEHAARNKQNHRR
jgi:hypothetical protein